MPFVQIFALWAHKCLIYPTMSKIRIFVTQPNSLEQTNKQISKMFPLGPTIFPFFPVLA